MSLNKNQFQNLIEKVLKEFGMYSESATNLLLGTAAQESRFGTYIKQINGPACGVFQIEPLTYSITLIAWLESSIGASRAVSKS